VVVVSTSIEAARFAESNDHAWRVVIVVVAVAHLERTPCYQFWLDRSKEEELKRRFLEAASGVLLSPATSNTDVMVRPKRLSSVFPFRIVVGWSVWRNTYIRPCNQQVAPARFIHSIVRHLFFLFFFSFLF
jgi:hypothetical protein